MINIQLDDDIVNKKLDDAINAKVEELAHERYFLTMQQLSQYINLSIPVIHDRLILNDLPHYRMGTKYLFKKSEVDEFLDAMTKSLTGTNDIRFFEGLKKETERR